MEPILSIEDMVLDEEEEPALQSRDLVYEVGAWGRYIWEETKVEERMLSSAIGTRYPGTEWDSFSREVFARLYGVASKLDTPRPGAEWAEPLHQTIGQLPEWSELVSECRGDEVLSMAAAVQVQNEVELPKGARPPKDPVQAASDAAQNGSDPALYVSAGRRIAESRAAARALSDPGTQGGVRRQVRRVLGKALESAREAKEAAGMLGFGDEPSSEQRVEWSRKVRENPELVRICRLAGRMEADLNAKLAEVKSEHGREDLVGLRFGSSVSESVPMERALFSHPVLGLLQAAKMSEGRLLQNRQVGLAEEKKAGNGPLIFACDESGSMSGERNVMAKAVALTLARRCSAEGRTFAWVHWSNGSRVSVWPGGKSMSASIADELCTFMGGGTNIPHALQECEKVVLGESEEFPKDDAERADVVLITDACSYEYGSTRAACESLKKTGARLWTFHIGDGSRHEELYSASESYQTVTRSEVSDGSVALSIHQKLEERK